MKWISGLACTVVGIAIIYFATAILSLVSIVHAVRAGDGATVLSRTDVPRVRHAMVDQIVGAYLQKQGAKRKLTPFQRLAIDAYGSTVADETIRKLTSIENLNALMRTGSARNENGVIIIEGLPPLGDLNTDKILEIARRFRFVKPVEFFVAVGQPEDDGGVSLHFAHFAWQISSVRIPSRVLTQLVERLPSP